MQQQHHDICNIEIIINQTIEKVKLGNKEEYNKLFDLLNKKEVKYLLEYSILDSQVKSSINHEEVIIDNNYFLNQANTSRDKTIRKDDDLNKDGASNFSKSSINITQLGTTSNFTSKSNKGGVKGSSGKYYLKKHTDKKLEIIVSEPKQQFKIFVEIINKERTWSNLCLSENGKERIRNKFSQKIGVDLKEQYNLELVNKQIKKIQEQINEGLRLERITQSENIMKIIQ